MGRLAPHRRIAGLRAGVTAGALASAIALVGAASAVAVRADGAKHPRTKGTAAGDHLRGGSKADRISGKGGSDTIYGGSGNDRLLGGSGNDRIFGNNGSDLLDGGAGNDLLHGDSRGRENGRGGAVTRMQRSRCLGVPTISSSRRTSIWRWRLR